MRLALVGLAALAVIGGGYGLDIRLLPRGDRGGSGALENRWAGSLSGVQRDGDGRLSGNHDVAERISLRIYGLAADGAAAPVVEAQPTASITQVAEPTPTVQPLAPSGFAGETTHYGESFNGLPMACGGTYWSSDLSIAAVAYPSRDADWPCGTAFQVSGPRGSIRVVRTDSCPGCNPNQLDLSETGQLAACGYLGRCPVWIEVLDD